ncbi:MAG: AtpZ/AtpI family protein [Psychrilyobacter sp.]|nr:AtpZ/AtpI family protein [Psychrilyobacter sp.]
MKKRNEILYNLSLLTQIGLTMVFSIILGVVLYKVIEKVIGSNILLFIFLIILGVIGGFYNVYRLILRK